MAYSALLFIHSWLRWAFLLAALYAIFRSLRGKMGDKQFSKRDNTAAILLIALSHTMLLLGIILLFVSPIVQNAFSQGASVFMKDKLLRLIVIEHPLTNIIAVGIIQAGRIYSKKAYLDSAKHTRSLVFYGIGLILILSRIPWSSSPLFRAFE